MATLDIAIVGCGVGGLAAAAFLAREGHHVRLYERFEQPKPLGAGLMLQPTGLACLARLGLDDTALTYGNRIDRIHGQTTGGRVIFDLGYGDISPSAFGVAIHRGALFSILLDAAVAAGNEIHTGVDVKASTVDPRGRWLIDTAGTQHGPFDLVIDASGMRSPLRLAEADIRLHRPNPYGAVWGVLPLPSEWPHKNQLRQKYEAARIMVGVLPVGRRPGDDRELATLFWSLRQQDYPAWRDAGLEAWKRQVLGIWPALEPVLASIISPDQMTLASYSDTILRRPNADRLIFIGDAARTASPQLGQGANLALADALILAECLKQYEAPAVALDQYAKVRRSHTRFYSLASRWLTPFFQSDSRTAALARDLSFGPMRRVPYLRAEMARTLAGVKTGLFSSLDPGDWHERYRL